jgi:hypothetical protein
MTFDPLAIVILVVAAGLGSVAGYLGRITQKLEDRRDDIYLKELPAIYASTMSFTDSIDLYVAGGSLQQFADRLEKTSEKLRVQIFSADIVIFKEDLYKLLLAFSKDLENLQGALNAIQEVKDQEERSNREAQLKSSYNKTTRFDYGDGGVNPKQVRDEGDQLNTKIKKELGRYRSYSWKLMLAIFGTGAALAALDLVKSFFTT